MGSTTTGLLKSLTLIQILLFVSSTSTFNIAWGQEIKPTPVGIGLYKWKEGVILYYSTINCKVPSKINEESSSRKPFVVSLAGQAFRVIKIIDGTIESVLGVIDTNGVINRKRGKEEDKNFLDADKTTKKVALIEVADYDNSSPYFYVYNFNGDSTAYKALPKSQKDADYFGEKQFYFLVDLDLIESFALRINKIPTSLAFGLINFPFKYRPQEGKGDFTGAFNFGAAIGITLPHQDWRRAKWSLLSGYSIANIVLDSVSTRANRALIAATNNYTALSFSLGAMCESNRIQVGAFVGFDRISRITHRTFEWEYQGKPWFSIGFGYAIFSSEQPKADNSAVKN